MAYTIQKGDRLGSLAKQYNTTVDQLMALNPQITNPNKIYAGDTLNLPGQIEYIEPIEVVESAGAAPAAAAAQQQNNGVDTMALLSAMMAGGGGSGSSGLSSAYNNAISSYQAAQQGLKEYLAKFQADQNAQIAEAYKNARNQAYVNGRLNAIGNNEVLASMGLSGNMYAAPQSGYTETARVAENLQMRNAIADANAKEKADVNALAMEIMKQNAEIDVQTAQYMAQMQIEAARAQAEYEAQRAANQMAALQMMIAQQNADRDFAFQQEQFRYQQEQDALAYQLAQQQAAAKSSSSRSSSSSKAAPVSFGGLVDDDPYYLPTANTYYTPNTVTTPTAVPTASGNTANAQAVISQITRGVSSAMSGQALKNNVTTTVGNRYNSGSLTSAEANYILDFFGV